MEIAKLGEESASRENPGRKVEEAPLRLRLVQRPGRWLASLMRTGADVFGGRERDKQLLMTIE